MQSLGTQNNILTIESSLIWNVFLWNRREGRTLIGDGVPGKKYRCGKVCLKGHGGHRTVCQRSFPMLTGRRGLEWGSGEHVMSWCVLYQAVRSENSATLFGLQSFAGRLKTCDTCCRLINNDLLSLSFKNTLHTSNYLITCCIITSLPIKF